MTHSKFVLNRMNSKGNRRKTKKELEKTGEDRKRLKKTTTKAKRRLLKLLINLWRALIF